MDNVDDYSRLFNKLDTAALVELALVVAGRSC